MRLLGTKLGSISTGRGLGDPLYDTAAAVPSLDLRFADSKSLVDAVSGQNLITFTRSSNGTYVDSQGVLRTAATNEPRFDHNPTTGECLGLLVEEQCTNSIRNNTMVGAVAGTPGTLPTNWTRSGAGSITEIVGTGTENGITYIDIRFTGTVTNTNVNFEVSIAAAPSQTWTASSYIRLLTGIITGAWRLSVNEFGSGGVFLRTGLAKNISPTSAALSTQRLSGTFTTGASTQTLSVLLNGLGSGQAVDFTLRIGLPQLEQGAFATSPILTSGTAATRSADVASITGSNFSSWYRQDEGTMYCGFSRAELISSTGFANLWAISDGTASERYLAYNTGGSQTLDTVITDNGTSQGTLIASGTITANSIQAHSFAYKVNDFAATRNAGAVEVDTSGTLPTVNVLYVGASHAGNGQFSGTIRRLTYFPQRLPNATLQSITQ